MNSNLLLLHIRNLSLSTTKYLYSWNTVRQRCLLYTSFQRLNTKKLSDKSDGYHELSHMRLKPESKIDEVGR